MRRRHGFATMYVSHKSVGVGVLDDPAARPRRAELLDVSESGTSGRGWNPARISYPNAAGVSPLPGDCGGDDDAFASTTSVDISNKRRPSGAATSLFPSFTSVNNAVKQFAQTPRPQTSDRTTGVSGRGGWDAAGTMGPHTQ